jgi:hypothetical protein
VKAIGFVTVVLFLLAVSAGFGSSGSASVAGGVSARYRYEYVWQAASQLSSGCAHRIEWSSGGVVFARGGANPAVYYADEHLILSSLGDRFPHVGWFPTFWPCRTPVAIYQTRRGWMMTLLASKPANRRTIPIGRLSRFTHWEIAPNGRFLFFHGQTIQYVGEKPFTVRGLPPGWTINSVNASPRNPSVFVANVLSPAVCSETTDQFGAAYLISSGTSTKLRNWGDVCPNGVNPPDWTPNGRRIVWSFGDPGSAEFFSMDLSDAHGRHLRKLLSRACEVLWSPSGKEIAYDNTCSPDHEGVYVLDLTTGNTHFVADGELEAWSPDGSELALLQGYYCDEAGSIVIVPAAGGPEHTVITWPASC